MKTTNRYMMRILNFLIVVIVSFANFVSVSAEERRQVEINDTKTDLSLGRAVAVVGYTKTTPANGSVIALPASSYYILQWTDALLPETDRYQYCIDTTNNNSCDGNNWVTRDSLYSGGQPDINFAASTTYYWQVRARDAGIFANGGTWWSFTTSGAPPPATFNKTTPANGAVVALPVDTYYLFQWTDLFLPATDRYQYCIDQTNNNVCDGDSWITRDSLYSGAGEFTLEHGKTYYWQVKARDAGTVANGGAWWSFTTSNAAVVGFSKTTPANGSTFALPDNTYYLLQWTDALLPSTDRYQYCIDTTNNNSCDGNNWFTRNSLYSGGVGDLTLAYGQTYYWQVRARDANVYANGGAWWSFTIEAIASPPSVVSIVRASADPTNAASVDFTVTFNQTVTGVDISDFVLNTTIGDASITNVSGTGTTRTVTVNTGTVSGTIRLDFVDDDSVQNNQTTPVGGVGPGNGNFTSGQVYTINKP